VDTLIAVRDESICELDEYPPDELVVTTPEFREYIGDIFREHPAIIDPLCFFGERFPSLRDSSCSCSGLLICFSWCRGSEIGFHQ
jgi:hypothetical protein